MKTFLKLVFVCVTFAGRPSYGDIPAVDLSSAGGNVVSAASFDFLAGWQFSVNSPISVTSLGLYSGYLPGSGFPGYTPSPSSGMVGLWDATSHTLLTSADVLDADQLSGGFKYHAVLTLSLEVGHDYIVAALIHPGNGFANGTSGDVVAPEISFVAPRMVGASDLNTMPINNGWGGPLGGNNGFYAASFEYVATPEPSTCVLAGLGAVFLWVIRRRS